jgi:hypothetical protein
MNPMNEQTNKIMTDLNFIAITEVLNFEYSSPTVETVG